MDTSVQYKAGIDDHMNFMIDSCRLNLLHIKNSIKNNNDIYRDPSKVKEKQYIYGLRRDTFLIRGEFKAFHRVFVKCEQSGKYAYLGWVINDDAECCMVCQEDFYGILTTGKHHCRACGILICTKCSVQDVAVAPIENYKPVRVCSQCFYDQSTVDAHFNYNQGIRITGNFYIPEDNLNDAFTNTKLLDLVDTKDFGSVYFLPVTPIFAIKSHFQSVTSREKVFVNITTCPYVPYNGKILIGNERLIFMNIGDRGTSISGVRVYDICVHPRVTEESFRDVDAFRQLCEQALLNVALHDVNDTFQNFVIIPSKQLRKALRGTPNEKFIKDYFKGKKYDDEDDAADNKSKVASKPQAKPQEEEPEPYSEEFTNYIERMPIDMEYEGKQIPMFTNKGAPQYFVHVLSSVDEKAKAKMTAKQLEDLKLTVQPVLLKENHNHDLEVIIMTIPNAKAFEALYTCSANRKDVTYTEEHLTIFDYVQIADEAVKEKRKKKRAAAKSGKADTSESSSWFFNPFAFLFSSSPAEEEKKKTEEETTKTEGDGTALEISGTPADEMKGAVDGTEADDGGIGENVILLDDNGYPIIEETKKPIESIPEAPQVDGTTTTTTDATTSEEQQAKLKATIEKQKKLEAYRSRVTHNLYGSYDPSADNHGKTIGSSATSSFAVRDAHGNVLTNGVRPTPIPSTIRKKVMVRPYPGFVIKTHLAGHTEQKVFINVYHHHHLEDMMKKENITVLCADDIFVLVGEEVHNVLDKQQSLSELYHVVVSSSYFHESYLDKPIKITNPEGIFKILEAINDRFELQLDSKNYSLPRVKGGFKGERIPMSMIYSFVVRKLIGNTPGEHRPVLSPNSQLVAGGIIDSSAYSNGGGGGEEDGFDERSSISSTGEGAGKTKRRSSVLGTMFSKGNKNAITEEMIQDRPELCVDWQDVIVLKNYSCEHADILIGWQVAVYKKPNTSPEIYVITGMKKSTSRKTVYCLSHPQKADFWTGLKRSADKQGLIFRPNRKVYFPHVPNSPNTTDNGMPPANTTK